MGQLRRYKSHDELNVDEMVLRQQARKQGKPEPRFERPEYVKAKATALRKEADEFRAEGLDDDADELDQEAADLERQADDREKPLEEMTSDEHNDRRVRRLHG